MQISHATNLARVLAPAEPGARPPLNDAQHRAVVASDEAHLVLAGPGTGKTRVLVYRAAYLLLRDRDPLRPQEVGLFTYTNKAARQLRTRLHSLIGPDAQYVRAGTLHHFAYTLVKEHAERLGLENGFAVADEGVLLPYWEAWCRAQRDAWKPKDVQGRISLAKLGIGPLTGVLVPARQHYDEWLRRRRLLDYDDLLVYARDLVVQHAEVRREVRGSIRALLIDEFQDTDPVQYAVLTRIAGRTGTGLYCVADDDQSIYGFRGAWPRNVRKFMEDYGCVRDGERHHVLNRNYRSIRSIFRCAESVLDHGEERLKRIGDVDVVAGDDEDRPVRVVACDDEAGEHRFVLEEVDGLLRRGVSGASVAILAPFNNRLELLERMLLRMGIPCETSGGGRLTEQPVLKRLSPLWAYLHERVVAERRGMDLRLADELMGVLAAAVLPAHAAGTLRQATEACRARGHARPLQRALLDLVRNPLEGVSADEVAELTNFTTLVLNLTDRALQPGATVQEVTSAALDVLGSPVSVLGRSLGAHRPCPPSVSAAASSLRGALSGASRVLIAHSHPSVGALWQLIVREVLAERRVEDRSIPHAVDLLRTGETPGAQDVVITIEPPRPPERWDAFTFVLGPELTRSNPLPSGVHAVDVEGAYESPSVRLFRLLQETFAREPRPLYESYVMVDVEATSPLYEFCEVVELAALKVEKGVVTDRFERLIELPKRGLTAEEATTLREVCRYDLERDFADAVPEEEAWAAFCQFVSGLPLVAHNGQLYDFRVLDRLARKHRDGVERTWTFAHDMLPDARVLFPSLQSHSAESLRRELLGDDRETRHRALPDCEDQQRVLERLQVERAKRSTRLQFEGALAAVAVAATFEPDVAVRDPQSEEATLLHAGVLHLLRGDSERARRIEKALGGQGGAALVRRSRPLSALMLERLDGSGLSSVSPSIQARLNALIAPHADAPLESGGLADLLAELALWGDEESPAQVVTLSTYHSAKGLEFEHVYCIGASQGCFPMGKETRDRDRVSESRRVLYVGMTRAERYLTVSYAQNNPWGKPLGPSIFLRSLPPQHHQRGTA